MQVWGGKRYILLALFLGCPYLLAFGAADLPPWDKLARILITAVSAIIIPAWKFFHRS
jgi:hypothetical protein